MAYGSSWARSWIGAAAASLHHSHSNIRSSCIWDLCHSLWQHRILNPLSEARDGTCNLVVPSWIHFCCVTTGTPSTSFQHPSGDSLCFPHRWISCFLFPITSWSTVWFWWTRPYSNLIRKGAWEVKFILKNIACWNSFYSSLLTLWIV